MITILHNESCAVFAKTVKELLYELFHNNVSIELVLSGQVTSWPGEPEWNDLLIFLFDESSTPEQSDDFIRNFLSNRQETALLLPVAINNFTLIPPGVASEYKALPFDNSILIPDGGLTRRVGAMLGLRLQGRNTKVFISYRAVDGTQIAKQIEAHLHELGYKPWRDEALELDGDTRILPGDLVQKNIESALTEASLLLLIDTPESINSRWIAEEINIADGMLIPILPVVFRTKSDQKKGPRLRTLLNLQRWVDMPFEDAHVQTPLSEDELDTVTQQIETYLCDIFIRRCRVPFIVENSFKDAGYDWASLNKALSMYRSSKVNNRRFQTTVNSHCSAYSEVYLPALDKFRQFLKTQPNSNYAFFIYDGDLLSFNQLECFLDGYVTVLHYQEVSALLASNFVDVGNK
ncbi:UNVERIFIED_ORG: TIR domain-containing protein [Citrobacter freundii]